MMNLYQLDVLIGELKRLGYTEKEINQKIEEEREKLKYAKKDLD